jgi:hypothetical protein
MKIKVLWIDDEWVKQKAVITDAEQDGIDLVPHDSHEKGMLALYNDKIGFHAVILDAKVKKNEADTVTGTAGLRASIDRLIELNKEGIYLPYFIFTGQPDYMENDVFIESYGEYYVKGRDNQKLFDDIKHKLENKNEYIVQIKYKRIFNICNKYFDNETKQVLNDILLFIEKPQDLFNDELYFTQLRIIIEKLFRQANQYGFLHDKCIMNGKVNLIESCRFLSGEQTKYLGVSCSVKHFTKIISEAVMNILFIGSYYSHTTDSDFENESDFHSYKKLINTPYMLISLTFQLFDILIWFDEYVAKNNDVAHNKSLWRDYSGVLGKIVNIKANGWAEFKPYNDKNKLPVPKNLVELHELKIDQEIIVRTESKTNVNEIINY